MTAPHTLLQSRERLSTVAGDLGEPGPSPVPITVWAALSALGLIDLWLCHSRGLVFASSPRLVLVTLALAGLALFYRVSGRSQRIADMAHWTVLWVVFSITGAIPTYLAATRGGRLYDGLLAGVDARLGFD